jgi:hypothetical protein
MKDKRKIAYPSNPVYFGAFRPLVSAGFLSGFPADPFLFGRSYAIVIKSAEYFTFLPAGLSFSGKEGHTNYQRGTGYV